MENSPCVKRFCLSAALVLSLLLVPEWLSAQKFTISTNIIEYANLGTLNLDASYAFARRWSVNVGARYNPFSFKNSREDDFHNKQQSYSVGVRFWPWHVCSGWWLGTKLRYQEYSTGGIISPITEEGDRWGAGVYAGYSYMLHRHVNIDFGVGLWGGGAKYSSYSCPRCGVTVDSGDKAFILPDDIMISLVYVF